MILKFNRIFLILIVASLLSGCSVAPEEPSGTISIARLKSSYRGRPLKIVSDCSVEGIVVSSDRMGNFHNMLAVEDATGGIALLVDNDRLFRDYRIGDSVRVDCNSLTLGAYGGALRLGDDPSGGAECSAMSPDVAARHITVHGFAPQPPEAVELRIAELTPRHIWCYVRIVGVRFIEQGVGWADELLGSERRLVDAAADTLAVRTRPKAEFASQPLPSGQGSVDGILGYFAGRYELLVNSSDDNDLGMDFE